jgi:hypothetical protein
MPCTWAATKFCLFIPMNQCGQVMASVRQNIDTDQSQPA